MDTAVQLVTEGLTVVGAIVSVYLAVGIAAAFVEGEFAAMTGSARAHADVLYRIGLLTLCVALVAFANVVAGDVASLLGNGVSGAQEAREAILRIGVYFLDMVIGLAIVVMAVGVAFGFVDGQLQTILGRPGSLSTAMTRVVGVVLLGVGALFTVTISRIVIRALGG